MRYLLPLMALILLACYARAQVCPPAPEGYIRQYRPQNEPANYPPTGEPACYMMDTQSDSRIPGCSICHINSGRIA